jgi:hypothetical protein
MSKPTKIKDFPGQAVEQYLRETGKLPGEASELAITNPHVRTIEWPDPTPEMLASPKFEAVWQAIKSWDINVPEAYGGYCGATGNHVRAILDALAKVTQ